MIRRLRSLRRDERGATLMEFAFVAPVMLLVIMGLLDMTYRLYATAVLQGAVQKAARDSTLEGATTAAAITAVDQKVKDVFKEVNGAVTDASYTFTRRNFDSFTNAGKKEPATGPGGLCATGFTYVDNNNSGSWDDGGNTGQGGADDVTLYTVQVRYRSLFPINGLFGASDDQTIIASTVLRNQPYGDQVQRNAGQTRACP